METILEALISPPAPLHLVACSLSARMLLQPSTLSALPADLRQACRSVSLLGMGYRDASAPRVLSLATPRLIFMDIALRAPAP